MPLERECPRKRALCVELDGSTYRPHIQGTYFRLPLNDALEPALYISHSYHKYMHAILAIVNLASQSDLQFRRN